MFAAGEEPVGVRVLTYQSSRAIKKIIKGLDEEEILSIRASSFGKIIDIGEKPLFSGRFTRYMMSRQLKVKKKHEVWFRFAGQPIRFSLREFAIVTGLPCGKFPPKSKMKMKETITEKPYWPSLFGKVEVVTVSSVIKMLRRRTVTDRETRIKFACLAILSSVLLPTSLNMKISREHAEAIEDMDDFYSFPWGRLAYEMLMNSIKERDEISLSQNTIAVKGFALALQLVLVEAVPSLTEVVQETCSSSESESADDVEEGSERSSKKQTLSPAHARNLDKKTEVYVKSIIDEDPTRPLDESTLGWYDEVEDVGVDNLVKLINQGYKFCASMFKGGATKADVQRMREDAKERAKEKKSRKAPVNPSTVDGGNCEAAAGLMDMIKPDLMRIDGNVSSTMRAVNDMITKIGVWHGAIKTEVGEWMGIIKEEIQGQISLALKEAEGTSTHPPAVPIVTPPAPRNPYKTPLRQNIQVQEVGVADGRQNVGAEANVTVDPQNDGTALSASSHTHMRKDGVNEINVPDNETKEQVPEAPSFSLGLTQQEKSPCNEQLGAVRLAADLNVGHDEGEENVEGNNVYSEVTITKFQQLGEKLLSSFVINVAGLSVSDKDIKDIAERSRPLSAKVVDVVTRILRTVQDK
ncbi:BnaCnng16440D [Brassica napus]|uniref:BnaCnng16440D protein n=2 Tax=Brassica TaxID=3705 RepID=A0A078ICI2_BRANA|nr:BnaCnng16440D [Brassica napus]